MLALLTISRKTLTIKTVSKKILNMILSRPAQREPWTTSQGPNKCYFEIVLLFVTDSS